MEEGSVKSWGWRVKSPMFPLDLTLQLQLFTLPVFPTCVLPALAGREMDKGSVKSWGWRTKYAVIPLDLILQPHLLHSPCPFLSFC